MTDFRALIERLDSKTLPLVRVGEIVTASWNFTGFLDSGETLASVGTITEDGSSNLSISNEAVNTAQLSIEDVDVAIGYAVQAVIDATSAVGGRIYELLIPVTTSSSPAQTRIARIAFRCAK